MDQIDLNADIGESYGVYKIGADEDILNFISSANIACGFHAGDPHTMKRTVQLAIEKGVTIGAHPGFPDIHGFGRRPMPFAPEEIYDMIVYQIGALAGFAQAEGVRLHHVKPHGALYNMAAKDEKMAEAIAQAVFDVDPALILYGLSGSMLVEVGKRVGLQVTNEAFSDRNYNLDGSLVPRSDPKALITDAETAVNRVIKMIKNGMITSVDGVKIKMIAETVCLHGDSPMALTFAKVLSERLKQENILIKSP